MNGYANESHSFNSFYLTGIWFVSYIFTEYSSSLLYSFCYQRRVFRSQDAFTFSISIHSIKFLTTKLVEMEFHALQKCSNKTHHLHHPHQCVIYFCSDKGKKHRHVCALFVSFRSIRLK